MKVLFKLAWRNIWRNRRRTLITASSIMFAVLLSSILKSIQHGAWNNMVDGVVNYYYGYAQIHSNGYWNDKEIDNTFEINDVIKSIPFQYPEVQSLVPRLESFALASNMAKSSGTLLVGIDVRAEDNLTDLSSKLISGDFLSSQDIGALMAKGLSDNLDLKVGDTLILLSQGYHGTSAAGKYPIRGLLKFGSPQLNKQLIYLTLSEAQAFYGADSLLTSVALKIASPELAENVVKELKTYLDTSVFEVMDYKELLPELMEAKALDVASANLILAILYFIVAFGILGTILMMVKEREYEFGILISIGMKRSFLSSMIWIETAILGLIGAFAGILLSAPITYYLMLNPITITGKAAIAYEKFGFEPIFPADFDILIFVYQALVVFILTSVLALYPFYKIKSLNTVDAMRP